MKKIKNYLLVACVALLSISLNACKKDKKETIIEAGITATVNGQIVHYNVGAQASTSTDGQTTATIIAGANSTGDAFSVVMSATPAPGTFTSSNGNIVGLLLIAKGGNYISDPSSSNSAVITIVKADKTNIQGTFTGTLTGYTSNGATTSTIKITDGSFNVNY